MQGHDRIFGDLHENILKNKVAGTQSRLDAPQVAAILACPSKVSRFSRADELWQLLAAGSIKERPFAWIPDHVAR
jgi:hypothetical protein